MFRDVPRRKWRKLTKNPANVRYICNIAHRTDRGLRSVTEYCVYACENLQGVVCKWALRVDGHFRGWWCSVTAAKRFAEIEIYGLESDGLGARVPVRQASRSTNKQRPCDET